MKNIFSLKRIAIICLIILSHNSLAITSNSSFYFFVIQSHQAHLAHRDKNVYQLIMPKKSINPQTLAISERPNRLVSTIPTKLMHIVLSTKSKLFKSDPANIAITWISNSNDSHLAFELLSATNHRNYISYSLRLLKNQKAITYHVKGPVSIYIDNFNPPCSIWFQQNCSAEQKQEYGTISNNDWQNSPINGGDIG